jgi:thiopurine S-methyltransferase
MHPEYWHERWRTGQTGFHQAEVHPFLERWWPRLGVAPGARVYVPLCGRSLDLAWLAGRGHAVVGSELSPIAIREFFAGCGLVPSSTPDEGFLRHAAGPYTILEGDALALPPAVAGAIDAIYDRAALVALPAAMRVRYARSIERLAPSGTRVLLVAFEYPQELKDGPPFSVEAREIRALFGPGFAIEEVERVDVIEASPKFVEAGVGALHETAFTLVRR